MKTKLPLVFALAITAFTLSQCTTGSDVSTSSSRPLAVGQVTDRIYEENGHRYVVERRVICLNPLETVTTTTRMAEPPSKR